MCPGACEADETNYLSLGNQVLCSFLQAQEAVAETGAGHAEYLLTITPTSSAVLPGAMFIWLRPFQHLHHYTLALANKGTYGKLAHMLLYGILFQLQHLASLLCHDTTRILLVVCVSSRQTVH